MRPTPVQPVLLIADAHAGARASLEAAARGRGFDVHVADALPALAASWRRARPDLVVLDLRLRDADGIEALRFLASTGVRVPVVLTSGSERRLLDAAMGCGRALGLEMVGALRTPVEPPELGRLLDTWLDDAITPSRLLRGLDEREVVTRFETVHRIDGPRGDRVVGVHAHTRWLHPVRGELAPADFLHVAGEPALLARLADLAVRSAASVVTRWAAGGVPLTATVPLPPGLLADPDLPERLEATWREAGLTPWTLRLELPDGPAAYAAGASLARLRTRGFGLTVGGFGVGRASLAELHRLPIDELKLHRTFAADLALGDRSRTIARCALQVGATLGLRVVATGVDSWSALQWLRELGYATAQGGILSRPRSAEEVLPPTRRRARPTVPSA